MPPPMDAEYPLVIAHRGASWYEPENTLPAFERAVRMGADFVELDVHAGDDGTPVVTHDPPSGESPLGLAEVVHTLRGRIGLMVELKQPYRYRRHGIVERVVRLLDDADDVLLSFEATALKAALTMRPRMRVIQHVGYGVSIRSAADYAWGVGFDDQRLTAAAIATARRLGLVTTVYTVNDEARMRELLRLGVDGIYSDRPDVLAKTAASAERRRRDPHPPTLV